MAAQQGIVSVLVNPKNGELMYGEWYSQRFTICFMNDDNGGSGYFNNDEGTYSAASSITGLPRVHTPSGVTKKGGGLGTVLYTGLCHVAHQVHDGELRGVRADNEGDGISSQEGTRSAEAEQWWTRAKRVYKLAVEMEGCARAEFDDEYSVDDEEAASILSNHFEGDIYVRRAMLRARGEAEQCGQTADAYPFEKAEGANLVVASVKPQAGVETFSQVRDHMIEWVYEDALGAANVGLLWDLRMADSDRDHIFDTLIKTAMSVDAPKSIIEGMYLRYKLKIDIDVEDWQHPDYSWVEDQIRGNPVRKCGKHGCKGHRAKPQGRVLARKTPTFEPKFYGRRSNPDNTAEVKQALTQLAKLRQRNGWDVFAADPDAP